MLINLNTASMSLNFCTLTTGPNTSSQTTRMFGLDVDQHGRLDLRAVAAAAGQHARALLRGLAHPGLDALGRRLVDQRADVGRGIERIAES